MSFWANPLLRLLDPLCSTQNHIQLKFPSNRVRVKSPEQVFLVQNLEGNIAWFFTFSLRRQCNKAALSEPVITIIILLQLPIFVPLRLYSVSTYCSCQFLQSMQHLRIFRSHNSSTYCPRVHIGLLVTITISLSSQSPPPSSSSSPSSLSSSHNASALRPVP